MRLKSLVYSILMFVLHAALLSEKLFKNMGSKDETTLRRLFYLTNLAFLSSTLYWLFSILKSSIASRPAHFSSTTIKIRQCYNMLYQIAFVLTSVAGVVFWCLYFHNKHLVIDIKITHNVPMWNKIIFHGGAAFILLCDLFVSQHELQFEFYQDFSIFCVLGGTYCFAQNVYKELFGKSLYGFQEKLGIFWQSLIYITAFVVIILLDFMLRFAIYKVNNLEVKEENHEDEDKKNK
jgi:hypothetical protein